MVVDNAAPRPGHQRFQQVSTRRGVASTLLTFYSVMRDHGNAVRCVGFAVSLAAAGLASPAAAQQTGVGVVTNLTGSATVARSSNAQPLRFKDSVYERDRIATAEKSLLRVLLGGKALVTMRELSELTITDAGGFAGLDLSTGKMGLSVARQLMAPGEVVQIRTPNSVASVQGSVVITEVSGGQGAGAVSLFNVLSGPVEVVAGGASINVGSRQRVRVSGGTLGPIEDLSPEDVSRLAAQLKSALPQHTDVTSEFQQELAAREQIRALSKTTPKTSGRP